MTVNELSAQAEFKALTMPDGEREITGVYIGDLLSWVMGRTKADCAWIPIMSNINIVPVASLADTACIILAESVELPEDVVSTATQKNVNILSSELGAYEIACKLNELI